MHKLVLSRAALAVFAAAGLFVTGCGHKVVSGPVAAQAPEWVNQGNGAFKNAGNGVFYGVGIASGIRNRALAVQAADDRARSEIAKTLETYVSRLGKDYAASTTAGAMDKSSEEQLFSSTMKSVTSKTLNGAMIVDHWKDPSDGTMFALAKLDFAQMIKMMGDAKELDAKTRDWVKANAEKAFDELNAEEAKRK